MFPSLTKSSISYTKKIPLCFKYSVLSYSYIYITKTTI